MREPLCCHLMRTQYNSFVKVTFSVDTTPLKTAVLSMLHVGGSTMSSILSLSMSQSEHSALITPFSAFEKLVLISLFISSLQDRQSVSNIRIWREVSSDEALHCIGLGLGLTGNVRVNSSKTLFDWTTSVSLACTMQV